MKYNREKLGQLLKVERGKTKKNQAEFAEIMGFSQQGISRFEAGRYSRKAVPRIVEKPMKYVGFLSKRSSARLVVQRVKCWFRRLK